MSETSVPQERSSLLLVCHGAVKVYACYATGGGRDDKPYVVVRSPTTLIYCEEPASIAAATYTMLLAKMRVGRLLPAEYFGPNRDVDRTVTASLTLRGTMGISEPRVVDALNSPDGHTHVMVGLDGLTLRAYDRASLDSHCRGWIEAYHSCGPAFGQRPELSIEALLDRAAQRARSPYQLDTLESVSRHLIGGRMGRAEPRSSDVRHLGMTDDPPAKETP
jgi:hypothetical protein